MSSSLDSLILEHLRHIRGRVDQIADDVSELKHRMTALEGNMGLVKREVAYGDETDRLERIERRLELAGGE